MKEQFLLISHCFVFRAFFKIRKKSGERLQKFHYCEPQAREEKKKEEGGGPCLDESEKDIKEAIESAAARRAKLQAGRSVREGAARRLGAGRRSGGRPIVAAPAGRGGTEAPIEWPQSAPCPQPPMLRPGLGSSDCYCLLGSPCQLRAGRWGVGCSLAAQPFHAKRSWKNGPRRGAQA